MPRHTSKSSLSGLALNLKRLRKVKGFSQESLARAAKISRSTLAAIELDRWGSTDSSTLVALSRALGVTVNEIMGLESGQAAALVDAFLKSPWCDAIRPTADEVAWLRSVPTILWSGPPPTAESIAKLVLWRRESLRG